MPPARRRRLASATARGRSPKQRVRSATDRRNRSRTAVGTSFASIALNRQKIRAANSTPMPSDIQRTRAFVGGRGPSRSQNRHKAEADHAAERQHGEHVAMRRDDDFGEHVGDAERDRRGEPGCGGKEGTESQAAGTRWWDRADGIRGDAGAATASRASREQTYRKTVPAFRSCSGVRRSGAAPEPRAAASNEPLQQHRRAPERSDQLAPDRCAHAHDPARRRIRAPPAAAEGICKVPNIQSHSARQLPRFLLKCAGLRE